MYCAEPSFSGACVSIEACQPGANPEVYSIMNLFNPVLRTGLVLLATSAAPLGAAIIPGLFNSGVGNNGVALAIGAQDPHYLITAAAQGPINTGAIVMQNNTAWLANSAASTWI